MDSVQESVEELLMLLQGMMREEWEVELGVLEVVG